MLEAARLALAYTDGMDGAAFVEDGRTHQAVILNLVIIGEAAAKMMNRCPDFAAANSGVPWQSMRGMRNRIAHGYYDIDLETVWRTVETALPDLVRQLEQLYP